MIATQTFSAIAYSTSDRRAQEKLAIATQLIPNALPLPVGQFSLIVADPPWQYTLRESDKTHRGRCPYPSMSDREIIDMGVGAIAAEDAYLLLWATNNHLPVAFQVAAGWGFEYKSLHTWIKTTKDESKIRFGIGHYGRNCTEHFLVCKRGKAKTFTGMGLTNIPTAFHAPVGKHSEKPEKFYELAEKLASALGGNKIELFSRRDRAGWMHWGAEVGNNNTCVAGG